METKEKLLFLIFFWLVTPVLIVAEILLLIAVRENWWRSNKHLSIEVDARSSSQKSQIAAIISYGRQTSPSGSLRAKVVAGDARPILIRRYLEKYHSPLTPYADFIFAVSQKYGLDYRLLVAIAQQESNLCKKIPPNSHNCWGWGIHSRGTLKFSSYPEAIEAVAKGLRKDYLDKGLLTPEQIMTKYTPLSNGSWAFGVNQFMKEIEELL